ncbi:membrane protein [Marivirga lumbricoides]|uniref:Membrane protein n=1 Tax=Marivirga lumbricoides TaxID=1046115 RepID=A0A2T4DP46_9BACT|nr:RagB/SusD family nutrient uptake outer membrane protein [Marivirga lumbricoides]GGC36798.1 membrane protein [Marivirga lumbricoides]
MKLRNILKPFILLPVVFSSCNEDLLEKNNPNQIAINNFFETEAQLQATVNAIYSALQASDLYGREYFFLHDMLADENDPTGGLEAPRRALLQYDINDGNFIITSTWRGFYRVINRANLVIANADKVPELQISEESRNRLIAEAKFLRAWAYFELVSLWGDVPLLTEPAEETEGDPRAPESDVYALIFEDLTFAEQNLKVKSAYPDSELGRATKGSAQALAGKIRLFRGEYELAKTELQKVITSSEYMLVPRYLDNFEEGNENNQESIFEVQFTTAHGVGNPWSPDGDGIDEVTFRGQEYPPVTGWNNVNPRPDLISAFEAGDPRLDYNFYQDGDTYNNATDTMEISRPGWRKYSNAYQRPSEDLYSGINFRVIRYADVLLMMAEAENEVGTTGNAVDYVNEVRARADVDMPALDDPGNKDDMFDIIVRERRVELACEQIRNRDLRRWHREGKLDISERIPNWQPRHILMPIPITEVDNNTAITTNNGY